MGKKRHKCANEYCRCLCDKDSDFCSEDCEDADGQEQCVCDHDDCYPRSGMEDEEIPYPRRLKALPGKSS